MFEEVRRDLSTQGIDETKLHCNLTHVFTCNFAHIFTFKQLYFYTLDLLYYMYTYM